ncbi:hypothetical protein N9554_02040 [Candidatus Thioglobus sp.]|nr:hypothetical protein [Candidatus Thioglobus sp.]
MKKLLLTLLISLPFTVFGQDISGTGWKTYSDNGGELIILFDSDGTFTYLNKVSNSGNEGAVFGDNDETWKITGNKVVLSYNSGYMLMSLTLNNTSDRMTGTAINVEGVVYGLTAKLIQ